MFITMVHFSIDAGSLSSALDKNELLTLAYYVDEMVCLIENNDLWPALRRQINNVTNITVTNGIF